ncbi:monooxygenase [Paraphaeosphaeria minitans]|uniref:Monooxygenase n=1 Tax=Paraphaeosphaeria minitans TaxID=565426 RepID=A0A9P6GSJ7_9PLEO|nr:monooxygenase [Paraphaeosphaeria minitans]
MGPDAAPALAVTQKAPGGDNRRLDQGYESGLRGDAWGCNFPIPVLLESFVQTSQIYHHHLNGTLSTPSTPPTDLPKESPSSPSPTGPPSTAVAPKSQAYFARTVVKYNLARGAKLSHLDPQGLAQKAASSTTGAPPSSSRPASSGTGNGPTSPGLHKFAGLDVHSAAWDEEWDCSGEKAAVIGNGSSAIQMMPEVAKSAARVVNFIKNSTWITLGLVRLSEEEKRSKEEPGELSRHRKEI